ncbi:MAG: type II toxin-antitoxin system VapC family toxin [Pyrinomonadaceae bacterium]
MNLFVLDTDHLSLYQRGVEPLTSKLLEVEHSHDELEICIISIEEQLRGRLAQVRSATTVNHLAQAYHWLHETFDQLSRFPALDFDDSAVTAYDDLLACKLRIGTQDLCIAAIVLSRGGVLLTRNPQDFGRIPSLQSEDWPR